MEHENINEITNREEACKRVKQMAEVIKKLKINNYLKIGGMSEKDRQAIELLEENMETVGKENGLQKLVAEIKEQMAIRYDMVVEETSETEKEDITVDDKSKNKLSNQKILEAYRGAIDAGKEALGTGKISKAIRCQIQADKYMQELDEQDQKRATEYKRELFLGLSEKKDDIKENVEKWQKRFKGCLKPNDFSQRKEMADFIKQMMKGREVNNGKEYAGSIDRS